MADIKTLPSAWRKDWLPASFRGAPFHIEAATKEDARRIVTHEWPKKEDPYSEDMGRRAKAFSVRGYCIQYPYDHTFLMQRDFRKPRDALLKELETEGPGELRIPLWPPIIVVCPHYRLTEEDRLGGYCIFDMSFVEYGTPPVRSAPVDTRTEVIDRSYELGTEAVTTLDGKPPESPPLWFDPLSGGGFR
jgi:prophage DNA circulation protein